jgi:hypothetical protein
MRLPRCAPEICPLSDAQQIWHECESAPNIDPPDFVHELLNHMEKERIFRDLLGNLDPRDYIANNRGLKRKGRVHLWENRPNGGITGDIGQNSELSSA